MGVSILHRKESDGQHTYHIVPVTDATGETFPHTFEETADEIEYHSAGDPGGSQGARRRARVGRRDA